nr:uncharacterized protein LOC127293949 isoform X2 [Lolium perenne]
MPSLADLELQPSYGGHRLVDVLRKPAMPPPALGDEAARRSGLLISLVTIRTLMAAYIAHQKDCRLVDFVRGVILVKHNAHNLLLSPRECMFQSGVEGLSSDRGFFSPRSFLHGLRSASSFVTSCFFDYQVQYTGAYQLLKFMLQPRIYQHQKYISQFLYGRDRWFWRSSREEGAREAVQRRSWRIREGLCWPGSVPHEDEHISLLTPSELSFFFQLMAGLGGLTGASLWLCSFSCISGCDHG